MVSAAIVLLLAGIVNILLGGYWQFSASAICLGVILLLLLPAYLIDKYKREGKL